MLKIYEAQDSRHTYEWSEHGILVRQRQGEWAGYYRLRDYNPQTKEPTRLVLTGYNFGDCPAELVVDFVTLGDIEKYILETIQDEFLSLVRPQRETYVAFCLRSRGG